MERRDEFFQIKVLISFFSLGIIIARVVLPNLKMDAVTLGLLIVAALPWFSELFQSAELPDGELLIGFRNPIPEGKALILPLTNPLELIQKEVKASFGEPIELDLGGLGIRGIEYWQVYQVYLIVAGAYDGSDKFALYWWSGNCKDTPQKIEGINLPSDFRPEAVLFYPNRKTQLQLLSDDGAIPRVDGKTCKEIKDDKSSRTIFP